jgi:hypothetical protein
MNSKSKILSLGLVFMIVFTFAAAKVNAESVGASADVNTNTSVNASTDSVTPTSQPLPPTKFPIEIKDKTLLNLQTSVSAEIQTKCGALTDRATQMACVKEAVLAKRCAGITDARLKICQSQTDTIKPVLTNIQADLEAKIKARMEKKDDKMDKHEDRIEKRIAKALELLSVTLKRLTLIADKIDLRIQSLNAQKVDTTVSAKFMVKARADIAAAQGAIDKANADWKTLSANTNLSTKADVTVSNSTAGFEKCKSAGGAVEKSSPEKCVLNGITFVNTNTPLKDTFSGIRSDIVSARKALQTIRGDLKNAVSNLKPGINSKETVNTSATQ